MFQEIVALFWFTQLDERNRKLMRFPWNQCW